MLVKRFQSRTLRAFRSCGCSAEIMFSTRSFVSVPYRRRSFPSFSAFLHCFHVVLPLHTWRVKCSLMILAPSAKLVLPFFRYPFHVVHFYSSGNFYSPLQFSIIGIYSPLSTHYTGLTVVVSLGAGFLIGGQQITLQKLQRPASAPLWDQTALTAATTYSTPAASLYSSPSTVGSVWATHSGAHSISRLSKF